MQEAERMQTRFIPSRSFTVPLGDCPPCNPAVTTYALDLIFSFSGNTSILILPPARANTTFSVLSHSSYANTISCCSTCSSSLRQTAAEAREILLAQPTRENEAKLDSLLRDSLGK